MDYNFRTMFGNLDITKGIERAYYVLKLLDDHTDKPTEKVAVLSLCFYVLLVNGVISKDVFQYLDNMLSDVEVQNLEAFKAFNAYIKGEF